MIHVEARSIRRFRTLLALHFPSKILNNTKKNYNFAVLYIGVKLCFAKERMETGDGL
jgi:hypothetical protein